jgi:hypothetical protein
MIGHDAAKSTKFQEKQSVTHGFRKHPAIMIELVDTSAALSLLLTSLIDPGRKMRLPWML